MIRKIFHMNEQNPICLVLKDRFLPLTTFASIVFNSLQFFAFSPLFPVFNKKL